MRKILLLLGILLLASTSAFAAKLPDDVKDYICQEIPNTYIRFDGVIILPDNTVYLPLFPSLFSDINSLQIKETIPANQTMSQKPDVIIFNNDFVMIKVIPVAEGKKTVLQMQTPPLQVRTGLLPQDMLVPSGLYLPENLKGIIGNLKIDTKSEDVIKQNLRESFEEFLDENTFVARQDVISQLNNKIMFVMTNYSKNIQVVEPGDASPKYSLAQKSIPISVKAVQDGKFLLVTSYDRPFLDVISVADSRFIKQINLSAFPEEILIDNEGQKAYIAAPSASTIFVVDLKTMSLVQKIKINGYCEKLILSENKIFYVDKLKNEIWAIDMGNGYQLVDIGRFPNVSALAFSNNSLFIASRTKSRVAVVDYTTLGLVHEFTTVNKPVAMQINGNNLYILGAQYNKIQKVDLDNCKVLGNIELNTDGFTTGFGMIDKTNIAIVTDVKKNVFSLVDLENGKLLKSYALNIPMKNVVITEKVKLFD